MAKIDAKSEVTGSVWKILKHAGDTFSEEDVLMIIESMKMEIPVIAEGSGKVIEVSVAEGTSINEGDTVMVLDLT